MCLLHVDYLGRGISSVKDNAILEGRPYGGLGFIWAKSLSYSVSMIETTTGSLDYPLRVRKELF